MLHGLLETLIYNDSSIVVVCFFSRIYYTYLTQMTFFELGRVKCTCFERIFNELLHFFQKRHIITVNIQPRLFISYFWPYT